MAFLACGGASDSSWTSPFPSFSSAQSSRLLTGARAESYGQIVDVPTPQVLELISERVVGQIVDLVAHRPAESVLPRFTELFHPLSSIWYFFHLVLAEPKF